MADESHDPAFLALNPKSKIPAIYDPNGPSGTPLALFESGAILLYLAEKTGQFISADGKAYDDKRPRDRYATESARLLGVLDERLAGRDWVMALTTASPIFRCSAGAQPDRLLRSARAR